VEHALMAQYLYAAWSVSYKNAPAPGPDWGRRLMGVAIQEMGHLITIQNILRAMRAPLSLDRDDYPFRSDLYPFDFTLEKLSLHSLAKYVLAEMPAEPVFPAGMTLAEVLAAAATDGGEAVNRVGELFERLLALLGSDDFSDADFSPDTVSIQAHAADWHADLVDGLIVLTVATKADALKALKEIADQGEGSSMPEPGAPPSHFQIFAGLFLERRGAVTDPAAQVPINPNTSPAPETAPAGGDVWADGRILNLKSRQWALLGNLRYRMLLTCIRHSISPTYGDPNEQVNAADRGTVRDQAFTEMHLVGSLGKLLAVLPQAAPEALPRAGMPLEMPYSQDFPDTAAGAWLMHRDLQRASAKLTAGLRVLPGLTTDETALLDTVENETAAFAEFVSGKLGVQKITAIHALRILPALAIARFGSSATPLENYDLGPAGADGWHPIVPAETLTVDPAAGRITGAATPAEVKFRDAAGLIKPVCPFLEVWAQFTPDGPLQPLTTAHLADLGLTPASMRWQVRAANLKAQRRTGDANDGIHADTGIFTDHAAHPLRGTSPNFKAGKAIPFGSVRYLEPTAEFPEIRLRFTPAAGKVFGPNAGDANIADDVYDSARGRWDTHRDGATGTPPFTEPGRIFAQTAQGVSRAYLDDACDAIVTVELQSGGSLLRAAARVASGPPHFSPDTLPIRTVADELEQWLMGPEIVGTLTPAEAEALGQRAAGIIRRALGTIRLMNTGVMNGYADDVSSMPNHDTGSGRAGEPVFPAAAAAYAAVERRHQRVLASLAGISAPAGSPQRLEAIGALQTMAEILRSFDQAGDLSDEGRRRMPAMMRNADGNYLAVTRRQRATVQKAAVVLGAAPAPGTPEQDMLALVRLLASGASNHDGISTGAGTLDQLFANPPALLDYLRTGSVQAYAPLLGQRLVVAGNPDASAFVMIIETQGHPMRSRFAAVQPSLGGRTGAQVVRAWIASLPAGPVA
jgi:hypothetical protein